MARRKKPAKKTAAKKKQAAARKKPGGSNVGKYKGVKAFAGPSGGAPAGSFPINTLKRAKSALKLAHNAPRPAGIRAAVYRKYPSLRPSARKKKTSKKKK
jgi:hypothetical protein|tara:strand:- start:852 stop:1151 length:300 start_codon:yes stop_codon:yes gene_type:complete